MPRPIPHTTRTRGYLPHWESHNATYSVTFRLADSLPQHLLDAYQKERQSLLRTQQEKNRPLTSHERQRLHELFSEKIEHHLDSNLGECHLRNPQIAALLHSTLHHFHTERYILLVWCIMPNHIHTLFTPLLNHTLDSILHTWKSYSAKKANTLLSRTGPFWMPEYYDHLIRDIADLHHHQTYILNNPQKANLKNWPHVGTNAAGA